MNYERDFKDHKFSDGEGSLIGVIAGGLVLVLLMLAPFFIAL